MANGLQSILELTLHIPISYENRTLSKSIMVDEVNTFEVIVSSLFEGERVLIVNFYIPNLDRDIDGVFFRGIHYYKKIFSAR